MSIVNFEIPSSMNCKYPPYTVLILKESNHYKQQIFRMFESEKFSINPQLLFLETLESKFLRHLSFLIYYFLYAQ